MDQRGMLLTLLAFLDVLGDILVHLWPPEFLGHCSVGQRMSSNMNIAYTLMELGQELLNLARVQTL